MSDNPNETPDTAGVVAPPPLIYAGALTVGLLAKALFPVRFLPRTVARVLGWPLVGSGLLLLLLSGLRAMHRAGTEVSPDRPTTSLAPAVRSFRFSQTAAG